MLLICICIKTTQKTQLVQRKEGSGVKQKSSMLEKAIRELEKMVAECMFA